MNNLDILSMCMRSMFKRKVRTILTILGVLIGTASIVIMISLGLAVNDRFDKEIQNMGDVTMITVYNFGMDMVSPDYAPEPGQARKPAPVLDDNAVAKFNRIPGVLAAIAMQETQIYIRAGRYISYGFTVYGVDPKIMGIFYEAADGRLLEPGDKNGIVFGANAELAFFKENDPKGYSERLQNFWMGEEDQEQLVDLLNTKLSVSIDYSLIYGDAYSIPGLQPYKPIRANCVGVLKSYGYREDNSVFMNINTVRKLQADQRKREQAEMAFYNEGVSVRSAGSRQPVGYYTAQVKCAEVGIVQDVSTEIRNMGFYTEFPTESLDSLQSMAFGMQALLGSIGAVSLLVAAIGIANTMIMSIYERTREIGVMKVIGAALSDIRKLFLLEAVIIGLSGGVLGVLLSLLISYMFNNSGFSFFSFLTESLSDESGGAISLITPWLCACAIIFASLVGLVSGYFPARRAMRLSAVNALNNV